MDCKARLEQRHLQDFEAFFFTAGKADIDESIREIARLDDDIEDVQEDITERVASISQEWEEAVEDFDTYEIPRFSWLPRIETVLIDDREAAPQGGGEPAIICMGGVIANAIYDAIGVRLFQMPMNPERIKQVSS